MIILYIYWQDLGLAQTAATAMKSPTPMGSLAHQIYRTMTNHGFGGKDFSSAFLFLQEQGDNKWTRDVERSLKNNGWMIRQFAKVNVTSVRVCVCASPCTVMSMCVLVKCEVFEHFKDKNTLVVFYTCWFY